MEGRRDDFSAVMPLFAYRNETKQIAMQQSKCIGDTNSTKI